MTKKPLSVDQRRIKDLRREFWKLDRQMVAAMEAAAKPYEQREAEITREIDAINKKTPATGGAA